MKKLVLTSLLTVFAVSAAHAAVTPYASLKLGLTEHLSNLELKFTQDGDSGKAKMKDKLGYMGAIAAGANIYTNDTFSVRAEVEYSYDRKNSIKEKAPYIEEDPMKMDAWSNTFLANAYVDFNTHTAFTPYISTGLGASSMTIEFDGDHTKLKDTNFAYQLGAGVAYALNESVSFDLGYRYLDKGMLKDKVEDGTTTNVKVDSYSHQLMLGARYKF